MANEYTYTPQFADSNLFWEYSGGDAQGAAEVGNDPDFGTSKAAFRFPNILIPKQTVNFARLRFYIGLKGTSNPSGFLKTKVYGIAEDNTSSFGGNPFGRTKTSANATRSDTVGSIGTTWDVDITSIISEITNRAGWSSNNAIGLFVEDNGSDSDTWIYTNGSHATELIIRPDPEPNFFPTPTSIAAPTFPSPGNFGIKVVDRTAGVDVRDATEAQLLWTSRKRELKVFAEADVACTADDVKEITHALGYAPTAIAFAEGGGKRFKLNRNFLGATDPVGGGMQGDHWQDDDKMYIVIHEDGNVYYYIFLDPLT